MPVSFQSVAHHQFDLAVCKTSSPAFLGEIWPDFNLELIDPGGQRGGACGAVLPLDAPILAAIRRIDVAGHMYAVGWQVVSLGLDVQQASQELMEPKFAEPSDVLTSNLKRGSRFGHWRHRQRFDGLQLSDLGRVLLQIAQPRHHRGGRFDRALPRTW